MDPSSIHNKDNIATKNTVNIYVCVWVFLKNVYTSMHKKTQHHMLDIIPLRLSKYIYK